MSAAPAPTPIQVSGLDRNPLVSRKLQILTGVRIVSWSTVVTTQEPSPGSVWNASTNPTKRSQIWAAITWVPKNQRSAIIKAIGGNSDHSMTARRAQEDTTRRYAT